MPGDGDLDGGPPESFLVGPVPPPEGVGDRLRGPPRFRLEENIDQNVCTGAQHGSTRLLVRVEWRQGRDGKMEEKRNRRTQRMTFSACMNFEEIRTPCY